MASTTTMQRVMITIPPSLLQQIETMMTKTNSSRSQLIREALEQYLENQRRQELRELLKEGYLYRAEESQRLAQEFFIAEQEAWDQNAPWEE
ncbi:MAG: ribbon-helix-helix protein, CopG family [Anaerolineae bacterium]|nr:ribbon-helix-helix protein, CopG family [Anaerolineae bacterium]